MKKIAQITLICLVWLTLSGIQVHAQDTGWSTPILLSSKSDSAWFPDIAADDYGTVHVVWSQATGNLDNVMYTSSTNGIVWQPSNDIAAIPADRGSEATRPNLVAMNTTSQLFMTFRYNQVYATTANNMEAASAGAWKEPTSISNVNQVAYYSDAQVDGDGNLQALITWNVPSSNCAICYHVFYRRLDKGSAQWTNARDVSKVDSGVAKPSLLIDKAGTLHAVWETSDEWGGELGTVRPPAYLMYSRSVGGGDAWTEPVKLENVQDESRNPAISQDRSGHLVMTWLGLPENLIYYRVSENGGVSWSIPKAISGLKGGWSIYNTQLDSESMVADSDDLVHLVLIGQTGTVDNALQVIHLEWNGSTWSTPDVVASYQEGAPEWPKIAVSEGNVLNVVWFLRDADHIWDTENGKYSIWFSHLKTSGTAIARKIRPTLTATSTVSSPLTTVPTDGTTEVIPELITPTLTIIQTVTPPVPENYIPNENAVYNESDYLKVILIAVLPTLFFLVGVIVFISVRKKSRRD